MKTNEELLQRQYVDLEQLQKEFLKYAPVYAQEDASKALQKVIELQTQGLIRNGIYYIVLVDLVGSTKYSAKYGNSKGGDRIENFVKYSFKSLHGITLHNIGLFVKEIGDAVLFLFQHFPDILTWRNEFQQHLDIISNDEPFILRTCVHIGEVAFNGVNPISLAISQTFKMEKTVNAGDITLTEPAYHVAWPTIERAYKGFSEAGNVSLDGFKDPVNLYKVNIFDEYDLARIVAENENHE